MNISEALPSDNPNEKTAQELAKTKQQVQELARVNASWEKYTHDLKNDQEKQISSLTKELSQVQTENSELKKKIKEYQERDKQREKGVDAINKQAEEQIKSAEEQKNTAVSVAMQQSNKVDELKASLHTERTQSQKFQERIGYLEKAVQNLRLENTALKEQIKTMSNSPGLHDECVKKRQELETEVMVLKEQVKVFKNDFDTERTDREKAQAEINVLETEIVTISKELKVSKKQLELKDKEIHALREANRELQRQLDENKKQLDRERQRKERPYFEESKYNVHIHTQEVTPRRVPSPKLRKATNTILSEEQKRNIRKNWSIYIENMMVDEIIPRLFADNVISLSEKQQIDAKRTSYEKAEYLMGNVILRGTQRDLRAFKSALIDTYQQHVAELLPVPAQATSPAYQYEEPMDIPPAAAPSTWHCSECTYANNPLRSNCEMCGKKKREMFESPQYMMGRGVDQCDNKVNGILVGDVEED